MYEHNFRRFLFLTHSRQLRGGVAPGGVFSTLIRFRLPTATASCQVICFFPSKLLVLETTGNLFSSLYFPIFAHPVLKNVPVLYFLHGN